MAEHQVMSWLPQHHSYKRDLVSHMNPPVDLKEHFIKMPLIAGPRRPSSQVVSIGLAKLEAPFSDSFVSEGDASHG